MSKISCFADCGESSLVIRVPYIMAIKMLRGLPNDKDKDVLAAKMKIAARRSKVFNQMLLEIKKT